MAVNLWARWKDLMPADPLMIADVLAVEDGRALVQYPGGSRSWLIGTATTGGRVFIQGGKVIGDAPILPLVTEEV